MRRIYILLLCFLIMPQFAYAGVLFKCEEFLKFPNYISGDGGYKHSIYHPVDVCNVEVLDSYIDFDIIFDRQRVDESSECSELIRYANKVYETEEYQKSIRLINECRDYSLIDDSEKKEYECLNKICDNLVYIRDIKEYRDFEFYVTKIKRNKIIKNIVYVVLIIFLGFLLRSFYRKFKK